MREFQGTLTPDSWVATKVRVDDILRAIDAVVTKRCAQTLNPLNVDSYLQRSLRGEMGKMGDFIHFLFANSQVRARMGEAESLLPKPSPQFSMTTLRLAQCGRWCLARPALALLAGLLLISAGCSVFTTTATRNAPHVQFLKQPEDQCAWVGDAAFIVQVTPPEATFNGTRTAW